MQVDEECIPEEVYDDDDDENNENNWRNDYPDEDEFFEEEEGDSDKEASECVLILTMELHEQLVSFWIAEGLGMAHQEWTTMGKKKQHHLDMTSGVLDWLVLLEFFYTAEFMASLQARITVSWGIELKMSVNNNKPLAGVLLHYRMRSFTGHI